MSSGENLDPRDVEAILDRCPVILRSCVVGNNFLKTSSQVVCAIIEPARHSHASQESILAEITRAIAAANRGLAPPLRISWSRVLILKDEQEIPITKKGAIFRKKLEALFGEQLAQLLSHSAEGLTPLVHAAEAEKPRQSHSANAEVTTPNGKTKDEVKAIVSRIVLETLKISETAMENHDEATFAEVLPVVFYDSLPTLIVIAFRSARHGLGYVDHDRQQVESRTRSSSSSQHLPHLRRLGLPDECHILETRSRRTDIQYSPFHSNNSSRP